MCFLWLNCSFQVYRLGEKGVPVLQKKDDSFKEFVIDQLNGRGNVVSRAMFGGYGLYREQAFFGIIHKGRLYFKTDPETQPQYRERGMKPFKPNVRQTLKN